jgi:hypothetical protein
MSPSVELTLPALRATIGNPSWMAIHQTELLQAVPAQWTSCTDLILPFGFRLKCLGCDWRQPADVVMALYWLTHLQLIEARKDPHGAGSTRDLLVRRRQEADR